VPDVLADPEYTASGYQSFGYRTALAVPLLRDGMSARRPSNDQLAEQRLGLFQIEACRSLR
jgi:hypothetical protein